MSDDRRFEREARRWLELGPTQAPERAIETVLLAITTTPQDRGRSAPWRTPRMNALFRVAVASAAALILVFASLGLLQKSSGPGPAANASPSAAPLPPTACPSGTPLASGTIATIAGTGVAGSAGDGGPALAATITPGQGIAVGTDGTVYFGDGGSVRRIRPDGTIESYASGFTGAGAVAFDRAGNLFVIDDLATIKRIDPAGSITTVAGTGVAGSAGDEGPALAAQIGLATLAVGPHGDLYFDDNYKYRTIDPKGVIHAFAGTGKTGFSGDDGPATKAQIGLATYGVVGVAAAPDGSVYVGDPGNFRIRRVDSAGIITTVVGSGGSGSSGDNGPALQATLMPSPYGLAVDTAGNLYIADWQANKVRKVDTAGIITTVAGNGIGVFAGDCGPATSAGLNGPSAVAVHDGVVYILEGGDNRLRMVVP